MALQRLDTSAILEPPAPRMGFVDVRDAVGRLLCRYNPHTHEVEVKQKNAQPVVIDLKQYQAR